MLYENDRPVKVTSVVISTQHSKDLNQEKVRELIIPYVKKSIPENYLEELDKKKFILIQQVNSLLVVLTEIQD